jgi:hypothetical protein
VNVPRTLVPPQSCTQWLPSSTRPWPLHRLKPPVGYPFCHCWFLASHQHSAHLRSLFLTLGHRLTPMTSVLVRISAVGVQYVLGCHIKHNRRRMSRSFCPTHPFRSLILHMCLQAKCDRVHRRLFYSKTTKGEGRM